MEFLTRLFPHVRRLQRDAIRIRSEREEWRQRYTSLHARTQQSDAAPPLAGEAEWRLRIALWSAEQARALPGDFVDCAAGRDSLSGAIMEALDWARVAKTFHLIGDCDASRTVSAFANVRIIRGADGLAQAVPPQIAWLAIAASETAAAEHFWPRLVPGAVLLLNDYTRSAWDAFADHHGTPILPLPTGQGIMVKR